MSFTNGSWKQCGLGNVAKVLLKVLKSQKIRSFLANSTTMVSIRELINVVTFNSTDGKQAILQGNVPEHRKFWKQKKIFDFENFCSTVDSYRLGQIASYQWLGKLEEGFGTPQDFVLEPPNEMQSCCELPEMCNPHVQANPWMNSIQFPDPWHPKREFHPNKVVLVLCESHGLSRLRDVSFQWDWWILGIRCHRRSRHQLKRPQLVHIEAIQW